MPLNSEKEEGDLRPRDSQGRFIKSTANPQEAVKTTIKIEGPVETITKGPYSDLDKPLVSLSINNPFKKILYWLNDIKKKQTTTFDLKIKVPLIALPVFLAVIGGGFQLFFNLGKQSEKQAVSSQPAPTPIIIVQPTKPPEPTLVSRLGTVKATYQVANLLNPTPTLTQSNNEESTDSAFPTILPTATPIPPSKYVLVGKNDQIIFLITVSGLSLQPYLNQRVIITGLYDKTKNTLKIEKSTDIELLQ